MIKDRSTHICIERFLLLSNYKIEMSPYIMLGFQPLPRTLTAIRLTLSYELKNK